MTSFLTRTALVLVSFPLFYLIIFVFPFNKHLIFNLLAVISAFIGSSEINIIVNKRHKIGGNFILPLLGVSIPLVTYLEISGLVWSDFGYLWGSLIFVFLFIRGAFISKREVLKDFLVNLSLSILVIIYPAYFISFIVKISDLENSSYLILFFLSIVFVNDIFAYLFGKFLGSSTRLELLVSPRKSLVGFIAGFLGSIGISLLFFYLIPDMFPVNLWIVIAFGIVIGFVAILGDLSESALKRSAMVKDSGEIIPGRGGLLDSIDSLLFVAPIFYYFFERLYG